MRVWYIVLCTYELKIVFTDFVEMKNIFIRRCERKCYSVGNVRIFKYYEYNIQIFVWIIINKHNMTICDYLF